MNGRFKAQRKSNPMHEAYVLERAVMRLQYEHPAIP